MQGTTLEVREMLPGDIELIASYWTTASPESLLAMGADPGKLPSRENFIGMLHEQLLASPEQKKSYCIIWILDGRPVGHSNINKIIFGEEAFMHLHIWDPGLRRSGLGIKFIPLTLPYFFKTCQLKKLFCEPYAHNPAPNKLLENCGFSFVKTYRTVPGAINFEQDVNLWELMAPLQ